MPCWAAKAAAPADSRSALFPRRPGPVAAVRACCPAAASTQRHPPRSRGSRLAGRGCGLRSRFLPSLLAESAARRPVSAAQDAAAATGAAGNDDELDDDEFTDSVSSDSISLCREVALAPWPSGSAAGHLLSRPRHRLTCLARAASRRTRRRPPRTAWSWSSRRTTRRARPPIAAHPASLYARVSLSLSLLCSLRLSPPGPRSRSLSLSSLCRCVSPSASLSPIRMREAFPF